MVCTCLCGPVKLHTEGSLVKIMSQMVFDICIFNDLNTFPLGLFLKFLVWCTVWSNYIFGR